MAIIRLYTAIFVWLDTAYGRTKYGRTNDALGPSQYGNGTRTSTAVWPYYTVTARSPKTETRNETRRTEKIVAAQWAHELLHSWGSHTEMRGMRLWLPSILI